MREKRKLVDGHDSTAREEVGQRKEDDLRVGVCMGVARSRNVAANKGTIPSKEAADVSETRNEVGREGREEVAHLSNS